MKSSMTFIQSNGWTEIDIKTNMATVGYTLKMIKRDNKRFMFFA